MCNAITGADFKIRMQIYEKTQGDVLKYIIKGCRINDNRLTLNILEAIEECLKLDTVLRIANTDQAVAINFERYQGLDVLEEVLKHPNMNIYNKCNHILNTYFDQTNSMQMVDTTNMQVSGDRQAQSPYYGGGSSFNI